RRARARRRRCTISASCDSLRGDDEMRAPVLRVRALVVTGIERKLLAVADRAQAIAWNSQRDEIRAGGGGAPLAQRQIVLGRAALVAVSLDRDGPGWIALQDARILIERLLAVRTEVAAVELVEHRPQRRIPIQIVERRRRDGVVRHRLRRDDRR